VAQNDLYYTGLAVININAQPVTATIEVYNVDGSLVATGQHQIPPGSRFSKERMGTRIPTLREVLSEVAGKLLINIEMANYASPRDRLPIEVVILVKELNLGRRVLLSSFNPLALIANAGFTALISIQKLTNQRFTDDKR
jgi:glycerophosphoryl diester phosphodiesterase